MLFLIWKELNFGPGIGNKESIKLLKVSPALRKPKGIETNLKIRKVWWLFFFYIILRWMEIWRYEDMNGEDLFCLIFPYEVYQPFCELGKDDIGFALLIEFNVLKSSQGRHSPADFFGTRWEGDYQGDLEGRIFSAFKRALNSVRQC